MVRRVWYRKDHARPGYFRHLFVIRTADWLAWLFLCAAFFLMLNTGQVIRTLLMTGTLIGFDVILNWLFFNLEARRIGAQTPGWSMHDAKRRVRQRAEREISG